MKTKKIPSPIMSTSDLIILFIMFLVFIFPIQGHAGDVGASFANKQIDNDIKSGDPIYTASGSLDYKLPLLNPGGLMDFSFTFIYNRAIENWWGGVGRYFPVHETHTMGPANYFWFTPYSAGEMSTFSIYLPSGDEISFRPNGSGYELEGDDLGSFYRENGVTIKYVAKATTNPDRFWVMDPIKELVYMYEFHDPGKLLYIFDRNGNRLTYSYRQDDHRLKEISDGMGRKLDFSYTDFGLEKKTYLSQVQDKTDGNNPKTVTFSYEEYAKDMGNQNALRTITDAMGHAYTFHWHVITFKNLGYYDNLVKVENPRGAEYFHTENTWSYVNYHNLHKDPRSGIKVTHQKDAYNNETNFEYKDWPYSTWETTPDKNTRKYDHDNAHVPPSKITDPSGKSINFVKDVNNRINSVKDRMGDTSSFSYHDSGKIASLTNNKGEVMNYTYTPRSQTFYDPDTAGKSVTFTFSDLTRIDYPDKTHAEFTYDGKGNMLTRTDANGNVWSYTYNNKGQILTITNPSKGVTTYTYNADETLASSTDSDSNTKITTYTYDASKRLIKITNPDSTTVQYTYNLNNQVTSTTDENGNKWTYLYDDNGNLESVKDPYNKLTQYNHDFMDRMSSSVNKLNKKSQYNFDKMNRLASVVDPDGNKTSFGYNSLGWQDKTTDAAGKIWQTAYDNEGVVKANTSPLGRISSYGRDKLGNIISSTDPAGHKTTFTRNSVSRVTRITDPIKRQTDFTYDNNGNILSTTLPDIGTVNFTWNNLGLLDKITDFNKHEWKFSYTNMGKLHSTTNPIYGIFAYDYDSMGRLNKINWPNVFTLNLSYDALGDVVRKQYSDGLDINFTYDNLGRMTGTKGLSLAYDNEGRVISTTDHGTYFGAAYYDSDRIKTLSYANKLFTVTYTYDPRGLLTRVQDDLSKTSVQLTYDDDSRLTGITRSNGFNTSFTLDKASRITRITHGNKADLQYTYNAAGEVISLDYTLPLDPADHIKYTKKEFSYDKANRIGGTDYGSDARGRVTRMSGTKLVWNDMDRITSINSATMTYNGLGDILTRTVSDITTRFYYNHAIDTHPVVAEMNETSGKWKRFYVLTPQGRLLYAINSNTKAVSFYHFDKTGNTLFLSNNAGDITDKYAYSPYGRLLAHEGASDQPFTFVGAWQVREEGGSIYQMGARYYDAATARFMSRESIWPNISEPKMLNAFQYAFQNPLNMIDPSGTAPINTLATVPRYGFADISHPSHMGKREAIKKVPERHLFGPTYGQPDNITTNSYVQLIKEITNIVVKINQIVKGAGVVGKVGAALGVTGAITKGLSMAYEVKAIQNANHLNSALSRIPSAPFRALNMLDTVSTGCVLVGGALSYYEIYSHFQKSPAQISRETGENAHSWNPLIRLPHELGNFVAPVAAPALNATEELVNDISKTIKENKNNALTMHTLYF